MVRGPSNYFSLLKRNQLINAIPDIIIYSCCGKGRLGEICLHIDKFAADPGGYEGSSPETLFLRNIKDGFFVRYFIAPSYFSHSLNRTRCQRQLITAQWSKTGP